MTLNISNKILKIVCVSLLVAVLGVGGYLGYSKYSRLTTTINTKSQENETLNQDNVKLTSDLDTCNVELTALKEKFGVALSDKEKAQVAATKSATEASRQKTLANQATAAKTTAEQNLSGCNYYLNAAAQLADVLDAQKQYYKAANSNILTMLDAISAENWVLAEYYANLADQNIATAESYEGRVNTLLGYFN